MSRSGAEIIASENRSKYIHSRISRVEHNFGQLCDTLSSYTRKTARLRDKGDQICSVLREYVDSELVNMSSKACIYQFADNFAGIQDYRQAQVNRLEANVMKPLCAYGPICKDAKVDIRLSLMALEKEHKSVKSLQKAAAKFPSNEPMIYRAKNDVDQATLMSIRTSKDLQVKTDAFEQKKVHDFKKIMLDFVRIEMIFHAKALELYTKCFHSVNAINPDNDFMEFRKYFFPGENIGDSQRTPLVSQYNSGQFLSDEALSTPKSQGQPSVFDNFTTPSPSLPYSLVTTDGVPYYKMLSETDVKENENEKGDIKIQSDTDDSDVSGHRKKVTMSKVTMNKKVKVASHHCK